MKISDTILDEFTPDGITNSCDYMTWRMRACCGQTKSGKPCGVLGSMIYQNRTYCWHHYGRLTKDDA